MNDENLVSISQRSTSEQREIQRKGGINSGKSRRKKRTMKENLLRFLHLQMKDKNGNPLTNRIMPKELLFSVGIEDLYKENKAVFCSYFPQFLDNYLFQKGVKGKYGYFLGRKLYFYVSI